MVCCSMCAHLILTKNSKGLFCFVFHYCVSKVRWPGDVNPVFLFLILLWITTIFILCFGPLKSSWGFCNVLLSLVFQTFLLLLLHGFISKHSSSTLMLQKSVEVSCPLTSCFPFFHRFSFYNFIPFLSF